MCYIYIGVHHQGCVKRGGGPKKTVASGRQNA